MSVLLTCCYSSLVGSYCISPSSAGFFYSWNATFLFFDTFCGWGRIPSAATLNDLGATLAVLSGDIYRCLTMIIVTFFFLSLSLLLSSLVLSCCYSNKTYISTPVWFHVSLCFSLCCRARWSWNESRNGNCAAFNFTAASISASHFREKVAVEDTSCTWVAFACLKYLRTNPLLFSL